MQHKGPKLPENFLETSLGTLKMRIPESAELEPHVSPGRAGLFQHERSHLGDPVLGVGLAEQQGASCCPGGLGDPHQGVTGRGRTSEGGSSGLQLFQRV